MGGILGVMGPPDMGGSLGTMLSSNKNVSINITFTSY